MMFSCVPGWSSFTRAAMSDTKLLSYQVDAGYKVKCVLLSLFTV